MTEPLEAVADAKARLTRFSTTEALPGGAPIYARLTEAAAADDELAGLLAAAPPSQRRATLFFAGIHYLLLADPAHPLNAWFRSPSPAGDLAEVFRSFCLDHSEELREIYVMRKTQTNEVQRSSYLVPAFGLVRSLAGVSLALIEPGAAAGLNLLFHRYFFDYGPAGSVGDPASRVRIHPEVKGSINVPVPAAIPEVSYRVGVDLEPVDVFDEDAVRWLRACVWAEHRHRGEMLERAIELARLDPPKVIRGDMLEHLPSLLAEAPPDAAACIFHTNVMPYLDHAQINTFVELLRSASVERDIYWLASEGWALAVSLFGLDEPPRLAGTDYSMLAVLTTMKDGELAPRLLARAAPHGHWIQWLDDQAAERGHHRRNPGT